MIWVTVYTFQCGILVFRLMLVDAYCICESLCSFFCALSTLMSEDINDSLGERN